MEYVIHLTDKCNLNCTYCYENKKSNDIDFENIKLIVDNEIKKESKSIIIYFYGGEPLLQRKLIEDTIEYVKSKKSKTKFFYGITTNGILLDEKFVRYMKNNRFVNIAYSIDGIKEAHDLNRVNHESKGSFDIVLKNSKIVLKYFKKATAMSVITKNNIKYLTESVKFLIDIGFKNIHLMINNHDSWNKDDLNIIKEEYTKLGDLYVETFLKGKDVKITLFDNKIKTYIYDTYDCNNDCDLGMKNIEVGADGNYYLCTEFLNNENYIIGNCKTGIDFKVRNNIIKNSKKENNECKECVIRKRCKHTCICKNFVLTKDLNKVSPFTCELEKIIIEISDKIANEMYEKQPRKFLKKYYTKDRIILDEMKEIKVK